MVELSEFMCRDNFKVIDKREPSLEANHAAICLTLTDSVNDFQETQVPHLLQAGFKKEKISTTTMDIAPPSECKYYSFKKMITPTIIKE